MLFFSQFVCTLVICSLNLYYSSSVDPFVKKCSWIDFNMWQVYSEHFFFKYVVILAQCVQLLLLNYHIYLLNLVILQIISNYTNESVWLIHTLCIPISYFIHSHLLITLNNTQVFSVLTLKVCDIFFLCTLEVCD